MEFFSCNNTRYGFFFFSWILIFEGMRDVEKKIMFFFWAPLPSITSLSRSLGHFGIDICPFVCESCNYGFITDNESNHQLRRRKIHVSFFLPHNTVIWVRGYVRKLTVAGSRLVLSYCLFMFALWRKGSGRRRGAVFQRIVANWFIPYPKGVTVTGLAWCYHVEMWAWYCQTFWF